MLTIPENDDADIKDHHLGRSPRTRASYTSRRGPIAKPAKEKKTIMSSGSCGADGKKKTQCTHFLVAS